MEFKENQAIYMQIVDFVCDQLLAGRWPEGERIVSVRELGVQLEVNPNTVMRAYVWLQEQGIIYNKRGIGLFVCENALQQIGDMQRRDFMEKELPEMYRRILLLGISMEEIVKEFEKYKQGRE